MARPLLPAQSRRCVDGRKLRELQEENARLKSMLADALLKLELMRNRTGRRNGSGKDR